MLKRCVLIRFIALFMNKVRLCLPKLETDADVGEASIKTNRRTKKLENRLIPIHSNQLKWLSLKPDKYCNNAISTTDCVSRHWVPKSVSNTCLSNATFPIYCGNIMSILLHYRYIKFRVKKFISTSVTLQIINRKFK